MTCKRCRKKDHFARFCKTKQGKRRTKNFTITKPTAGVVKVVTENIIKQEEEEEGWLGIYIAMSLSKSSSEGYFKNVLLNGKHWKMQIDTAGDHTIMCKSVYSRDFGHILLRKSNTRLCTYTGDSLTVCSKLLCEIVYDEQKLTLPLTVVDHPERSTLLGRSWLAKLRLNWYERP